MEINGKNGNSRKENFKPKSFKKYINDLNKIDIANDNKRHAFYSDVSSVIENILNKKVASIESVMQMINTIDMKSVNKCAIYFALFMAKTDKTDSIAKTVKFIKTIKQVDIRNFLFARLHYMHAGKALSIEALINAYVEVNKELRLEKIIPKFLQIKTASYFDLQDVCKRINTRKDLSIEKKYEILKPLIVIMSIMFKKSPFLQNNMSLENIEDFVESSALTNLQKIELKKEINKDQSKNKIYDF